MGYEPAAAEDIDELESRIGAQLPDSYRQFLETSNGWRSSGGSIYEIFPTRKVQWFRTNNREWIDAYLEPVKEEPLLSIDEHCIYGDNQDPCRFRLEYLESTLQISEEGDSAVYLLNPEIKTFDGEWEAWFFANWLAGATQYPSFWDLLHAECRSVIAMREEESRRFHSEYWIDTLPHKMSGLLDRLGSKIESWRDIQQHEWTKDQAAFLPYYSEIIEALIDARSEVQAISTNVEPQLLYDQLLAFAEELENLWQAEICPNECRGRAEGYREAIGIIRWFLDV